jgi:hypothetical protein
MGAEHGRESGDIGVPSSLQQGAAAIVGRQWVAARVLDWLQHGTERYFLLTGAPGSGKSTIAAWLAMPAADDDGPVDEIRTAWSARHFCMIRGGGGSIDPRRFIQLVAKQLGDRYDEFSLAVPANVGAQYNVHLEVRENWGNAIGVQIQNMFVTGATVTDVFSTAISAPLRAVVENRPDERICILVDGLDEALTATLPNIVSLLAGEGDLPDGVRFLLTSRNERRVVDRFLARDEGCRRLDLSAAGQAADNTEDLREYVVRRGMGGAAADKIVQRSAGNFLYARMLLDEVAAGRRQLTDLDTLPTGLYSLYRAYLSRLMPDMEQYGGSTVWLNQHRPLLGRLSAAVAPVPLSVLAAWLDRERGDVVAWLDDLQQLVRYDGKADGYQIYHASMVDFLAAERTEDGGDNLFFVSPDQQHDRIADYYIDYAANHGWTDCDDYGLANLPRHLTRSPDRLHTLLTVPGFVEAQLTRFGDARIAAESFRIALDVARVRNDLPAADRLLDILAQSPWVELRGQCVEGLVSLHGSATAFVVGKIHELLTARSADAWSIGLKAAYTIGPAAKDIFRWIALKGSPRLRQSAVYALYLRWSPAAGNFTRELLDDLSRQVRLLRPLRTRRILEFLTDLSITIYINNCDEPGVAQHTSDLWHRVIVTRLHLALLSHPRIDRVIGNGLSRMFGQRLLQGALSSDFQDPMRFFTAPADRKALFRRVVPYVDPTVDARERVTELHDLFRSDITLFRNLAQVVVAVHTYTNPERMVPCVRELAAGLDEGSRLWLLLSFSILIPDTPREWLPLLEELTEDFLAADPELTTKAELPPAFDIPLIPLGLAYAKAGGHMRRPIGWLRDALAVGDDDSANRLISWLAPVGLYYPQPVLQTLLDAGVRITDERVHNSVVHTLATLRTLHFDLVDDFLEHNKAGHMIAEVSTRSDIELVRPYLALIGFYNNVVHQAIRYPTMRYGLLITSLTELINADEPAQFIRRFTPVSLALLRDADYRLINWTRP